MSEEYLEGERGKWVREEKLREVRVAFTATVSPTFTLFLACYYLPA
jgi:hypothetical protein